MPRPADSRIRPMSPISGRLLAVFGSDFVAWRPEVPTVSGWLVGCVGRSAVVVGVVDCGAVVVGAVVVRFGSSAVVVGVVGAVVTGVEVGFVDCCGAVVVSGCAAGGSALASFGLTLVILLLLNSFVSDDSVSVAMTGSPDARAISIAWFFG